LKDLSKLNVPGKKFEIVLVDNGSTDGTKEMCEKFQSELSPDQPSFKYILNKINEGFAKACDYGFAESLGEYVLFLNNDIRVKSNFDNWVLKLMKPNSLNGPTIGYIDENCNFITEENAPGEKTYYPHNKHNSLGGKIYFYMSGWCLCADRKTWDELTLEKEVGPFSSEFGIAYYEDNDLSVRAKILNINCNLIGVPVKHFGRMTSKKVGMSKLFPVALEIFRKKWQGKLV
jgi:GT2 family glycosyltransferase